MAVSCSALARDFSEPRYEKAQSVFTPRRLNIVAAWLTSSRRSKVPRGDRGATADEHGDEREDADPADPVEARSCSEDPHREGDEREA